MAKLPGKCIFCGQGKLSKEHMWADWLREYIPREMNQHRNRSLLLLPDRGEESIERRTGDPHSRRIRCVCIPCNTGWMSRLQTKAKPFLVPTLEGEEVELHRRGQSTLAAWVTMFVMVAEHIFPDKVAITSQERAWFMAHQKPPSGWRIWIGRYRRTTSPARWFHHVIPIAKHESEAGSDGSIPTPNTQTSTILLGEHLVIHVMSSSTAPSVVRKWQILPTVAPHMQQIWPVTKRIAKWPTGRTLSDHEVEVMADEFFNRIDFIARDRRGKQ